MELATIVMKICKEEIEQITDPSMSKTWGVQASVVQIDLKYCKFKEANIMVNQTDDPVYCLCDIYNEY